MTITYDHKAVTGGDPAKQVYAHRITIAYASETYTTGGMAVDLTDSGLDDQFTDHTVLAVASLGGGGYVGEYDHVNEKLKVYYADYDAVADGALVEFPASALTATFTLLVLTY
jgi:hypothetical protein